MYETIIPRKWQYIASRLTDLGETELSNLAMEIDAEVVNASGTRHTLEWIDAYTNSYVHYDMLTHLAYSSAYCTPCEDAHNRCRFCKLSRDGQNIWKRLSGIMKVHEL